MREPAGLEPAGLEPAGEESVAKSKGHGKANRAPGAADTRDTRKRNRKLESGGMSGSETGTAGRGRHTEASQSCRSHFCRPVSARLGANRPVLAVDRRAGRSVS